MTDSPRRDGPDPTQPLGNSYPGYTDPAYASQAPYGPTYQAPGCAGAHRAAARLFAVWL